MAHAAAAVSTQRNSRGGSFNVKELWNEAQRENEYARQKGVHDRSDPENNFRRLYSATGFNTAWTMYQQKMLDVVNQKIAERGIEGSINDIVVQTARNPAEASLFNHASMAFNNDFYFSGISLQPNQQMPLALQSALERDFGSIDSLKEEMLAMADAMFGPGFVWLVRVNTTYGIGDRKFMLLPTYLAGSPLAGAHNRRQPIDMNTQNVANAQAHGGVEGLSKAQFSEQHMTPQNSVGSFGQYARKDANAPAYGGVNVLPCLCVNTWEHAYMYDWKFNKRMFLERWWMFINWQRVATLSDVEGDARRRQQRGFKGVGSSWRPSY